jgi:hypothetical protein
MRRVRRLAAVVCAGACVAGGSGCFLLTPTRIETERFPTTSEPIAPERRPDDGRILLHTRLLEQPLGADYLTHGVWSETADPLSHEASALLAANGLRVGVISGVIPAELERLATSDTAVVNASLRSIRTEQPKPIPVNAATEPTRLRAVKAVGEDVRVLELTNAECAVVVTAAATPDGRVTVRCEPRVQHGERGASWAPNATGTGFERHDSRPCEQFLMLAWEVKLARHEVLLIGSVETDHPDTLGQTFFEVRDPSRMRQRVLAVQADFGDAPPRSVPSAVSSALTR